MSTLFHEHQVYANTSDLPSQEARLDGWSPTCRFYENLLQKYQPASYLIEVGVWKGKSAACLAGALRQAGGGVLIAVDTWLGALEFWTRSQSHGKRDPTRDLYFHHGYPQVYTHFLANIVRAGLERFVIPFPVPSRLANDFLAQLPAAQPGLVHIDAAHEYADAAEDIRMWWALLQPGGLLLGDDFQPAWTGVVRAACEHAEGAGLPIFRPAEGGYVQKKWWVRKPLHGEAPRSPLGADWLRACTDVNRGWRRASDGSVMVVRTKKATSSLRRLHEERDALRDAHADAHADAVEVRGNKRASWNRPRFAPRGVNYVPSCAYSTPMHLHPCSILEVPFVPIVD